MRAIGTAAPSDRGGREGGEGARTCEPGFAQVLHVRHELCVTEARLELRHLTRDLCRSCQGVGLAFAAERALDGGERAHFRLPAGAIGVPALHLEQLLILHPATERLQERRPLARDDAGGREPERSREPRERAVPLLDDRAGLLLEQRLLEVARRDADVLPQREELVLRQPLADVALRGLELGRALDDPLERLAADELARHRYAST